MMLMLMLMPTMMVMIHEIVNMTVIRIKSGKGTVALILYNSSASTSMHENTHPSIIPGFSIFSFQTKQDATPESVPTTSPPQTVLDLLMRSAAGVQSPKVPIRNKNGKHTHGNRIDTSTVLYNHPPAITHYTKNSPFQQEEPHTYTYFIIHMRIYIPTRQVPASHVGLYTGEMFHYFCRFTLNVWMPDDSE